MKKSLWIAPLCLLLASAIQAAPVPKLQGPVNDYAGVLSPQEENKLRAFLLDQESKTSNQVVVLTVPSLDGDTIETFAIKVAEAWKLGQRDKDNGVLVVAAIKDHKLRIEVGKGLEGTLTDALSSQIIRNEIAPKFKAGDYGGGLWDGVTAIDKAIRGEYKATQHAVHVDTGAILFWMFVFIIFLMAHLRFGRYRNHWLGPYWVWNTSLGGFSGGFSGGGFSSGDSGGYSGGGGSFGGGGASGSW
jgi:uncharacterized protein